MSDELCDCNTTRRFSFGPVKSNHAGRTMINHSVSYAFITSIVLQKQSWRAGSVVAGGLDCFYNYPFLLTPPNLHWTLWMDDVRDFLPLCYLGGLTIIEMMSYARILLHNSHVLIHSHQIKSLFHVSFWSGTVVFSPTLPLLSLVSHSVCFLFLKNTLVLMDETAHVALYSTTSSFEKKPTRKFCVTFVPKLNKTKQKKATPHEEDEQSQSSVDL